MTEKMKTKDRRFIITDILLLVLTILPIVCGIIIYILTAAESEGIKIAGAQIYFTLNTPAPTAADYGISGKFGSCDNICIFSLPVFNARSYREGGNPKTAYCGVYSRKNRIACKDKYGRAF